MKRATIAALIGAWLTLTVWSAARADEMVPTVSILHDHPAPIEAEVRGLGIVQTDVIEEGVRGGLWWASLAVLADVGPTYELRVRAIEGEQATPWSPWRAMQGPVADACSGPKDNGAIDLTDALWVLRMYGEPGRVCVR